MNQQVPQPGWGAQPTGQQFPPQQHAGFAAAPPAGFGGPPPQQFQQPAQGPGGYATTAPPTQVIQPTQATSPPPQQPSQPAQRQLFPTEPPAPQVPPSQVPVQSSGPTAPVQPPQQPAVSEAAASTPQATAPQATATQAVENPTIQTMLRSFAKQPGCERYSGDAEKVKLLEQYLWCRQLMPGLTFEVFLGLFATVADFDEENAKHPADAIKKFLPRLKKAADAQNTHHWSSKEVVDYVALYVDMIRLAEQQGEPIPMTLNQFLTSQAILEPFHQGAFKEEPAPKAAKAATPKAAAGPRTQEKVRPTAAGQRVIYSNSTGRQFRGVLTNYWQDPQSNHVFCDFQADSGEEFKGIGLASFEMCSDPAPNPPQTNEGHPLPELDRGKYTIPKAQFPSMLTALAMDVPLGTVAIGDNIYSFNHQFKTGHVAVIDVVNGETGPYVDARLCLNSPQNVLFEVNPPRKNIEGIYTFEIPEGSFSLEVVGNK